MRRLFSTIAILFAINIAMLAQDDVASSIEVADSIKDELSLPKQRRVTEFMGIPIDGTKKEMIKQLKKKGFRHNYTEPGALKGEFNGQEVYVFIHTNKDKKVWRIALTDVVATNESDIKIKFNNLCRQFNSNNKYFPQSKVENYVIPNDESISYNMTMRGKRYDANFCQCLDTHLMYSRNIHLLKMETEKESEEFTSMIGLFLDYLAYNQVWFTIYKEDYKPKYRIVLYYENGKKQDLGKDL